MIDNNLFLAIVKKAQNKAIESYSAFQDEGGVKTEMEAILGINRVGKLLVYGIATDYCVKATALDASSMGYSVTVVEDLCRGVASSTSDAALDEMREKGIRTVSTLDEIVGEIDRQGH